MFLRKMFHQIFLAFKSLELETQLLTSLFSKEYQSRREREDARRYVNGETLPERFRMSCPQFEAIRTEHERMVIVRSKRKVGI